MLDEPELSPAERALGRRTDRTYLHASFRLSLPSSRDFGQWARHVVRVFDEPTEWISRGDPESSLDWTEKMVYESRTGRSQVKIQVAREAGHVRQMEIEQVRFVAGVPHVERVLHLGRDGARGLIDAIAGLPQVPLEDAAHTVRIDDQTLDDLLADPDALSRLYERDAERVRRLIVTDASAEDLLAVAHRREVVRRFRELLTRPEAFAEAEQEDGPDAVWQRFFEAHPWLLGVGLADRLLTSWDPSRLEQVTAMGRAGERVDALLETNAHLRALVFATVRHHDTELLGADEHRAGCWAPSAELSGAVGETQQTVDAAAREIGDRLADRDPHGGDDAVHRTVRPRSLAIVGRLGQFRDEDGVDEDKLHSFERYRRNLYAPDVVTFDELLARAEWHLAPAGQEHSAVSHQP